MYCEVHTENSLEISDIPRHYCTFSINLVISSVFVLYLNCSSDIIKEELRFFITFLCHIPFKTSSVLLLFIHFYFFTFTSTFFTFYFFTFTFLYYIPFKTPLCVSSFCLLTFLRTTVSSKPILHVSYFSFVYLSSKHFLLLAFSWNFSIYFIYSHYLCVRHMTEYIAYSHQFFTS